MWTQVPGGDFLLLGRGGIGKGSPVLDESEVHYRMYRVGGQELFINDLLTYYLILLLVFSDG